MFSHTGENPHLHKKTYPVIRDSVDFGIATLTPVGYQNIAIECVHFPRGGGVVEQCVYLFRLLIDYQCYQGQENLF